MGGFEERYTTVIYDPEGLPPGWPDVAAVILVGREREIKECGQTRRTTTSPVGEPRRRVGSVRPAALVGGKRVGTGRVDVTFGEDKKQDDQGPCRDEPELDPQGGLITSEAGPEQREHQLQAAKRRTR